MGFCVQVFLRRRLIGVLLDIVQKRLAGMQVGFRINALHVRVRRAGRDAELLGDFCLRKAHDIEREHLGLAVGK